MLVPGPANNGQLRYTDDTSESQLSIPTAVHVQQPGTQ